MSDLPPLPEPVGILIRGDAGAWRFSCGDHLLGLYAQQKGEHCLCTTDQARAYAEAHAAAMVAREREACAKLCEAQIDEPASRAWNMAIKCCIAAIRATPTEPKP